MSKIGVKLNHNTNLFRITRDGKTVARCEEVEKFETRRGVHVRGFNYDTQTGKRVQVVGLEG
jgi:hypothetical protein